MNILFWSGGKDSFLALKYYQAAFAKPLKLLTTFNKATNIVPFQNIAIDEIKAQAKTLNLDLIDLPLPPSPANEIYLERIFTTLAKESPKPSTLIFGDWHLEDIRQWRQKEFGAKGYHCLFPIWREPISNLLGVIERSGYEVVINSVDDKFKDNIKVGTRYDRTFVEALPNSIDPMGEKGEFHTFVRISS